MKTFFCLLFCIPLISYSQVNTDDLLMNNFNPVQQVNRGQGNVHRQNANEQMQRSSSVTVHQQRGGLPVIQQSAVNDNVFILEENNFAQQKNVIEIRKQESNPAGRNQLRSETENVVQLTNRNVDKELYFSGTKQKTLKSSGKKKSANYGYRQSGRIKKEKTRTRYTGRRESLGCWFTA